MLKFLLFQVIGLLRYFGFRNFSDVLESAKKVGLFELRRDQRSGSYVVTEAGRPGPGPGPVNGEPSGGEPPRGPPQFGD